MLSIDGTFLVILVSFLFFMVFMKTMFFGPILSIKEERESTVTGSHQVSQEAKSKAEQLAQQAETQLTEAKRKAHELIAEKRNKAKATAQEKVTAARNASIETYEAQARSLKDQSETVYNQLHGNRENLVKAVIARLSNNTQSVAAK